MKKRKKFDLSTRDADYVMYVNGDLSILCHPPHELSVENGGDDDPQYKLFFSRLRKNGSSYILKADETIGLAKPFEYEKEDDFDGDYAFFWKNLRFSGDNICFQHGIDHSVMYDGRLLQNPPKYDKDDGQLLQNPPKYDKDDGQLLQSPPKDDKDDGQSSSKQMSKLSLHRKKSNSTSEEKRYNLKRKNLCKFRENIIRVLTKPYDKKEHQKLLEDITVQKAQLKHIDLRSGRVRFTESDKIGKSYLEYHKDLKRKVNAAAKDDCKQLNLLRGFFFWIQNLTQEGSFIPWKDDECLEARPESS